MSAIVLEKEYQDTIIKLNKMTENFTTVFSQLQEAQSEIRVLKAHLKYSKMTSAQLRDEFANKPPIKQKVYNNDKRDEKIYRY